MAHQLLVPPVRRMQGTARLPVLQDLEANTRQWYATLRTRDSLRLAKGRGSNVAPGPLPAMQNFVMAGPGQPNTPESMAPGLRIANAPRLAGKTTGADVGMGGRATAANNATTGASS